MPTHDRTSLIQPRSSAAATGRRIRLREATGALHQAVEATVAAQGSFTTITAYAEFVRRSFRFYAAFEPCAEQAGVARLLPDWFMRRKLPFLQADCLALGVSARAAISVRAMPAMIDTAGLLGALYVTEGSTLGGRLLSLRAAALGMTAERGAAFLNAYGATCGDRWRSFLAVLESVSLTWAEEDRLIEAAIATFQAYQAVVAESA